MSPFTAFPRYTAHMIHGDSQMANSESLGTKLSPFLTITICMTQAGFDSNPPMFGLESL